LRHNFGNAFVYRNTHDREHYRTTTGVRVTCIQLFSRYPTSVAHALQSPPPLTTVTPIVFFYFYTNSPSCTHWFPVNNGTQLWSRLSKTSCWLGPIQCNIMLLCNMFIILYSTFIILYVLSFFLYIKKIKGNSYTQPFLNCFYRWTHIMWYNIIFQYYNRTKKATVILYCNEQNNI